MSVFGGADNDKYSEYSVGGEECDIVEPQAEFDLLQVEAESAQRLVVARMYRSYMSGSGQVAVVDPRRKLTGEKIFRIAHLTEWDSGAPDSLLQALAAGRVRTRLSARMGLGKTTKLAPMIARQLNMRVLLVSLDAACIRQVMERVAQLGDGKFRSSWTRKRGEHISAMTYADFCAWCVGGQCSEMFRSFDVMIFDESFVDEADVFVAKRLFAAYAHPETSLVLCSATIRTDSSGEDGSSSGLGAFRHLEEGISVEAAIETGKLVSDYLVDRTVVFVPSDSQIENLRSHYEANGVDVVVLDSAAGFEDLRVASAWLLPESTTPRVLVAHVSFGIGFNLPVAYSIIWPFREAFVIDGSVGKFVQVPLTDAMVTQMKSRTGRGIVAGSGGMVMSPDRGAVFELAPDQEVKAFVKMCAGGLVPLRNGSWDAAYRLFPEGLSPTVASRILKVGLPVEISARFFCSDEKVASVFVGALNVFSQPDHYLQPSDVEYPPLIADWPIHSLSLQGQEYAQQVPVEVDGELGIVLQAVACIALQHFSLERWRPNVYSLGAGYDSDGDGVAAVRTIGRRLRRVEDAAPPPAVPEVAQKLEWSYAGSGSGSDLGRRDGRFIDSARFREAVASMRKMIDGYVVADRAEGVIDAGDPEVVEVELPAAFSTVESPGGSPVCELPRSLCLKLHRGQVMEAREVVAVVWAAKAAAVRFVASRLFDNFSGPWESYLRSLCDVGVVSALVDSGDATVAYDMVDMLRGRFAVELMAVLRSANVVRTRFRALFRKPPSMDSLMRKIQRGDFDNIAQTRGFFDRVRLLKHLIDSALVTAERRNVYLPHAITQAQRVMALGPAPSLVGVVGHGLYATRAVAPPVAAPMFPESFQAQRERLTNRFARVNVGSGMHGRSMSN